MPKWCGKIGYGVTEETSPGVWTEEIVERQYYGDIIRNLRRLETSDQVNDNVSVSNEISIVSDPYAFENFHSIRWIEFMGSKWKVTSVEVQYPRLLLSLGGVYNDH